MLRKHMVFVLSIAVLLLFGVNVGVAQTQQTLTVFAASSLTDAFTEIGNEFKASHSNVEVIFNFGSSSTLATQLAEGAPADIFASANNKQMTVARDAKRIAGEPVTFVKNRLILIVPAVNPANIQSLHDLSNNGVKLVVAASGVPVRDYTDAMLDKLVNDPGYGESYKVAVLANIVSEEDNVRQVAAKVALGEADAGIVYKSDVTPDIMDEVQAIQIPDSINTLATYPIAITDNAADPALAQEFVDYVVSDAGQDLLTKWNFISVRIPELDPSITVSTDGKLTVNGQVLNPLNLSVNDLKQSFTGETVETTYLSGEETVNSSFTGVKLWDILSAAQPNLNADLKNDKLSTYLVVTASDGYQAVIAWGEIDPEFANQPILVAYEQDGKPFETKQGAFRLVVPGDSRGGRYVSGIVNISLRDAPPVSQ